MSMNTNNGTVNITGQASLVFQKNSLAFLLGSHTGAGDTTLGTVGAGKVWRITGMQINASAQGSVGAACYIKLNGTQALTVWITSAAATAQSTSATWTGSYADAIVLTAGQTVILTGAGSTNHTAFVTYVEEAA